MIMEYKTRYAILIPLVDTGVGDALLLEVRSDKVRQPGEVCFPGGRVEPGESVIDAAVRETCEELGIGADRIDIIRERGPVRMRDGRAIYPVEARLRISSMDELTLSQEEVAAMFLLPLDWLAQNLPVHYHLAEMSDEEIPAELLKYLRNYGGYRNIGETDYLEYAGHGIWGLTARIIKGL